METFHDAKKPAAVMKHAIIDSYTSPFAGKAGKYSLGHRVAFIDGYAGPGRYDNGEEGSGALLVRKARELASLPRNLELHFVESDQPTAERLQSMLETEASDLKWTVSCGDISAHLPSLLDRCQDIPLLVYLDPFGLVIPFDEVVQVFQRAEGPGVPATEVLINFSASSLRRIAGHLTSKSPTPKTLERMDKVCGGDWWRKVWLDHLPDKMAAESAVVQAYAQRLSEQARSGYWVIDVRAKAEHKPLYYLVFASRHPAGLQSFGESASLGLERWREFTAGQEAAGTLFGEDDSWRDAFQRDEKLLAERWVTGIADRIEKLLGQGVGVRAMDHFTDVFGDTVGLAREKHLRAAIKRLHAAGKTPTSPTGVRNVYELMVQPSSSAAD